jgi:hypothetical protein
VSARLEAVPDGLLSSAFQVLEEGAAVGRIEYRPLRLLDRGTVTTAGRELSVSREGVVRPNYLLTTANGSVLAKAEKQGLGGYAYRVRFGASEILVKKRVFSMRETFLLTDASGEVGAISRESLLSRRMTVELSAAAAGTPREVVLFLIWIALMIHRTEAAASA